MPMGFSKLFLHTKLQNDTRNDYKLALVYINLKKLKKSLQFQNGFPPNLI